MASELCIGGETTAQDLSNVPKTKALCENLTSVEFVESLVTKKLLLQKSNSDVVLTCLNPKISWNYCGWNIPVAWAQGHSPTSHDSKIHSGGALLKPWDPKNEHWQHRLFCRTASKHHFSILQTCILANKEKVDAAQEGKKCISKTNNHK